jgi:hypothetical protein
LGDDPTPFQVTLEPREVDSLDPDAALKALNELAAEQSARRHKATGLASKLKHFRGRPRAQFGRFWRRVG